MTRNGAGSACLTTGASKVLQQRCPRGGDMCLSADGIGWYRKQFTMPASHSRQKIFIRFDGVYQRSEVWVNGHSLGMRPNGYVSFIYDLTPHLQKAISQMFSLCASTTRCKPNSRWYSGSGIYRHTWLIATGPVRIAQWGTCIRPLKSAKKVQSSKSQLVCRMIFCKRLHLRCDLSFRTRTERRYKRRQ